jgi:hypothetical protein
MATFQKRRLSGSTNGKPINVTATATPGTTVHTAISGTVGYDEVYIWASNTDNQARQLTLEWGGTTDPGELLVKSYSIPGNSLPIPIALGQVMQNGLTIGAFADQSGYINLTGFVNRIS